jgi:hypothetical protein
MLNVDKILKVYNGRIGCMCGCLGYYRVPAVNREAASQDRGYPYSDEDVSDRSVRIIAKKVLSNPNVVFEDNYAYVEDRVANRMQMVVFKKESV